MWSQNTQNIIMSDTRQTYKYMYMIYIFCLVSAFVPLRAIEMNSSELIFISLISASFAPHSLPTVTAALMGYCVLRPAYLFVFRTLDGGRPRARPSLVTRHTHHHGRQRLPPRRPRPRPPPVIPRCSPPLRSSPPAPRHTHHVSISRARSLRRAARGCIELASSIHFTSSQWTGLCHTEADEQHSGDRQPGRAGRGGRWRGQCHECQVR